MKKYDEHKLEVPNTLTVTINKTALKRAVRTTARVMLGITIGLALLAMFGTAGALDNDAITVGQAVTRCLIGLAVFAGAVGGIRLTEVLE
jgi:glycerol uptake facilitator-like aquaporin